MCKKLRTVAASNNRDHPTRSLYYCLFAPHTFMGVILCAHPVRGELRIQHRAKREAAIVPNKIYIFKIMKQLLQTSRKNFGRSFHNSTLSLFVTTTYSLNWFACKCVVCSGWSYTWILMAAFDIAKIIMLPTAMLLISPAVLLTKNTVKKNKYFFTH